MPIDLKKELEILFGRLEEILSLANEGLLKSERLYETKYSIEDKLKELAKNYDERGQLMIEKNIPNWRLEPKHGIFINSSQATNEISPLKTLLSELLARQSDGIATKIKSETVINSGEPYKGRQYLRFIFDQATDSIFIRDSYFRPEILDILIEYLLDKKELKIKILMGENERLAPFKASYSTFKIQYPNRVEAKYIQKDSSDHPRYIIIDSRLLFNPDHSLDKWGDKTVNIHHMNEKTEIEKVQINLEKEWDSAIQI